MKRWTPEMDEFLISNAGVMFVREIAEHLGVSVDNVRYRKKVLGCDTTKGRKKYSKEMDLFLKENIKNYTVPELTELFNEKFNTSITFTALKQHLQAINLFRNLSHYEKSQLGHKRTKYNLFDEAIKNNFVIIKTKNISNNVLENWELKHRIVWREKIGEIPESYVFGFLDGDTTNCDVNNLFIYPKKWSVYFNQQLCRKDSNPQIKITALMCCQLHYGCKDKFYLGMREVEKNEK